MSFFSYIPISDLIVGHVYRLQCRNLTVGAYDGETFVGIREKFGRRYLDSEDHWDTGAPHGTAYPIEDIGPLPDGMSPKESLGDVCQKTGRPVMWDPEAHHPLYEGDKGNWVYADTRETISAHPESWAIKVGNTALYEYLDPLDQIYRATLK